MQNQQYAHIFEFERPHKKTDLAATVREIKAKTGVSAGFFSEWLKLSFGPGKLLFDEYLNMRLWDPTLYSRDGLKQFAGNWGMRKLWSAANFRFDCHALALNKIACAAVLTAHGLNVPPLIGLHGKNVLAGQGRTATAEELAVFLRERLSCPAFGKPLLGIQSIGSVSIVSIDKTSGEITLQDGRTVSADALAQEIHGRFGDSGYLFQPRLTPHPSAAHICGDRASSVRFLTIIGPEGPKIFRACWKIPTGANWADNFWRQGNLLATIDFATGTVVRAVSGTDLDMAEVDTHPDTGVKLAGLKVPLWEERKAAALAAAAVMSGDFGLLGWDIAATADGPVIIEANETPDVIMHQIADRRGVLDAEFMEFIARRRVAEKSWRAETRAAAKK